MWIQAKFAANDQIAWSLELGRFVSHGPWLQASPKNTSRVFAGKHLPTQCK